MTKTFSSEYFRLLLFSVFLSFITYAYALTNFSLSIDSEQYFFPNTSLDLGRWGTNLVRYHIFGGIIPYFTLLLSLILLSLSAIEFSRLFRFNTTISYIFCALFLTFPQMAYQLIFTMQADAISLGFLVSAVAVSFFLKSYGDHFSLKSAGYFIVSSLLFMFTIAIYQALAFVPVVVYFIIFFQNTYSENFNFKAELRKGLWFAFLVVISVILYFISVKVFCPGASSGGFLASYTEGSDKNLFLNFGHIWLHLISGNMYYGNKTFAIATIVAIIIIIAVFRNKKWFGLRLATVLLLIILPFIISFFITNGYNPPRLYVTSGIVFAFLIARFISSVHFENFEKPILIACFLIIIAHIYFITMLFWSHHKLYEHDINIARKIDNSIHAKYPDFDADNEYVYFFGHLPYTEDEKFRLHNSEIFGGSFFVWDNGSNDRIINFMKFSDVAYYHQIDKKEVYLKIKDSISNMSVWPKPGYIKRVDNVIIVKLGDEKGAPLWVE